MVSNKVLRKLFLIKQFHRIHWIKEFVGISTETFFYLHLMKMDLGIFKCWNADALVILRRFAVNIFQWHQEIQVIFGNKIFLKSLLISAGICKLFRKQFSLAQAIFICLFFFHNRSRLVFAPTFYCCRICSCALLKLRSLDFFPACALVSLQYKTK